MNTIGFAAMGTTWWVESDASLDGIEDEVRRIEGRLSRFLPDSALMTLNRDRRTQCSTLATVTRAAVEMSHGTAGAFDPTLGADLAALGYDRSFTGRGSAPRHLRVNGRILPWRTTGAMARVGTVALAPGRTGSIAQAGREGSPPKCLRVRIDGDLIELDGDGHLDLGGIAKGWTVDAVLALLRTRGSTYGLVDGGGDLRGFGDSVLIGVGGGLYVESNVGAIATSSTRRRRWRNQDGRLCHHILSPKSRRPVEGDIDTATVIAADAATADALATALLADSPGTLSRLELYGAHALVCSKRGHRSMTPDFPLAMSSRHPGVQEPVCHVQEGTCS